MCRHVRLESGISGGDFSRRGVEEVKYEQEKTR